MQTVTCDVTVRPCSRLPKVEVMTHIKEEFHQNQFEPLVPSVLSCFVLPGLSCVSVDAIDANGLFSRLMSLCRTLRLSPPFRCWVTLWTTLPDPPILRPVSVCPSQSQSTALLPRARNWSSAGSEWSECVWQAKCPQARHLQTHTRQSAARSRAQTASKRRPRAHCRCQRHRGRDERIPETTRRQGCQSLPCSVQLDGAELYYGHAGFNSGGKKKKKKTTPQSGSPSKAALKHSSPKRWHTQVHWN